MTQGINKTLAIGANRIVFSWIGSPLPRFIQEPSSAPHMQRGA